MRARGKPSILLLLLCIALGLAIYLELTASSDQATARPPPRAAPAPEIRAESQPSAAFVMPSIEEFAVISARPLFYASRRPPDPAEVQEQVLPPVAPQSVGFTLVGVVIFDGERMAILRRPRSKEPLRVFEGQTIDQWLIKTIFPTRVVLRQGETEEEITLKDAAPPRSAKRKKRSGPAPKAPAKAEPCPSAKRQRKRAAQRPPYS